MSAELSPPEKAEITSHLESCALCRAALDSMSGTLALLDSMQRPELDDLSWQRIASNVKKELERQAREPVAAVPMWGQRWVTAFAVVAAVVALFIWGSPPIKISGKDRPSSEGPVLVSTDEGFSVSLRSGVVIDLEPETTVQLRRADAAVPGLLLKAGELELTVPELAEAPAVGFEIRSPAFRLFTEQGRLKAGYWSREYFVEVTEGQARFRPEGSGREQIIHKGERRTFHWVDGEQESKSSVVDETAQTPAKREAPILSVAPAKKSSPGAAPPASELEPATRVEVVAPEGSDPLREKWMAANHAYYGARDLEAAIRLADEVVAEAGTRDEGTLALGLLCEAHLAQGDPDRAVEACREQLERTVNPEQIRALHYKMGSIHRNQRSDCRAAIEEYNQAMLFGRASMLDIEARLGRARCALELGDLEAAELDLAVLIQAPGVIPSQVEQLQSELKAAQNAVQKVGSIND